MFKSRKVKKEKIPWNDGRYRPYQAASVPPMGEPLRPPQEYNGLFCTSFFFNVNLFISILHFDLCMCVCRCTDV